MDIGGEVLSDTWTEMSYNKYNNNSISERLRKEFLEEVDEYTNEDFMIDLRGDE